MESSPVTTPPQSPPHAADFHTPPPHPTAIPLQSFVEDTTSLRSDFVFSLKIFEKLNEKNFLVWRQQVEPYVNANNLDDFLTAPIIPPRFLTAQDRATGKLNPEFRQWRLKDQMLLSWLQSTLSGEILALLVLRMGMNFGTNL